MELLSECFFQDHAPAHFHDEYQEFEAVIEIESLNIRDGELPNKARQLVNEWATLHREELLIAWNKAQVPQPMGTIAPLE